MNPFVKQTTKLVKGCIANNRSAQEDLYKLFYAEMLRLCNRYLKTEDLAMEALNTGFLKVFQNINSFDQGKGELHSWIKTIIVRTCIDLNRKELKFTLGKTDLAEVPEVFVSPAILEKLYAADLLKNIRLLPAATQLVFNLYVVDGYSHKEIAEQLNIGESTSRWHLTEAKKKLRELLNSQGKRTDYSTERNPKEK
jgi:RNA polymerase sigma factor (sigma-70 family)